MFYTDLHLSIFKLKCLDLSLKLKISLKYAVSFVTIEQDAYGQCNGL